MRTILRAIWHHPWRSLLLSFALLLVLGNGLAFCHARAMTRYVPAGERTAGPERHGFWSKVRLLLLGVTVPRPVCGKPENLPGLACRTIEFATADDLRLQAWLYRRRDGREPAGTVILFHGYASSRSSLGLPAREFAALGQELLLVDFRGSGGSQGWETTIGYKEAIDVEAACREASRRGLARPLTLYGCSMGAAAVVRALACHGVRPDRVILESVFDRLLTTVGRRFTSLGVPSFPAAQALVLWGGLLNGFNGFAHNPVDLADRVTCPALVVHGRDDARAGWREGERVCRRLAGPATFLLLDGGHTPIFTGDRKGWRRGVAAFMGSQ